MAYTKTTWQDSPSTATPLSAANLNHLETQYDESKAYADTGDTSARAYTDAQVATRATPAYVDAGDAAAVPKSLIDAKGDIVAGSADNTPARVAVGTDGQVLTADAASAAGVKWAAAPTGGTDPGAIPKSLIDAKGDILAGSANDTPARVAVGTDGQLLTADAASAAGVKWTTPVAYAPIRATINAQTGTAYTPVLADENKIVTLSNAGATTVTLPTDAAQAFPIGAVVNFAQLGAGAVTFAPGSGATVNGTPGLKLRAQYAGASAYKIAANTWWLIGDLSS